MSELPQDLPPITRDERRAPRAQDRAKRPPTRSAVRRVFTELMIYLGLIVAGAMLAVVSAYLLRKFGF